MTKSITDIWFDPSGYYAVALTTLLLCILISLYFANFLKDDNVDLDDEGLGADELHLEDDSELHKQMRLRLQNDIDEDEAYEEDEDQEPINDSDDEEDSFLYQQGRGTTGYNNLMGKFKAQRYQQKLESNLTDSQLAEERRIQQEQLAAIFELLRKQENELNLKDRISESELKQQVKLYR